MKLGFKYGMDAGGELSWEIWGGGDQGSSLGFEIHPLMRAGGGGSQGSQGSQGSDIPKEKAPEH